MPAHYDLPKSKKEAVGYILKKIGGMLKGSKARRLDDRRKADKGIEHRLGSNGHEPRLKLSPTKGNPKPRASDWVRVEGGWEPGRRFLKDRRRGSKFNIEKRKARDRGKMALKVSVPATAISAAAGAYSRKNKEKNNGKVETMPDYTEGGTLKLRELKQHEIETLFHSGIKNPKINPSAKTKLSGVSKEKARRDRMNTERIKKGSKTSIPQSTYDKGMGRVKGQIKSLDEDVQDAYTRHPYIGYSDSEAKKKKAKSLRKFVKADKKFR